MNAPLYDNTITIDDKTMKRYIPLNDGIEAPYLEDELKVRYDVEFVRVPVSERCVFCNTTYLDATKIKHYKGGYVLEYHVWFVDFLRAANVNYNRPVKGLLLIETKRWRYAGLPDCKSVFKGLCAVRADKHREIAAIETDLEGMI